MFFVINEMLIQSTIKVLKVVDKFFKLNHTGEYLSF